MRHSHASIMAADSPLCLLHTCRAWAQACTLLGINQSCCILQESSGKGSLGCAHWPLDQHVTFKHVLDHETKDDEKIPAANPGKTKYSARVSCQADTPLFMEHVLCHQLHTGSFWQPSCC